MSRRVVDEVLRLNETHGFLRGLTALVGFPQASVLYDRDPRATGDGKYNRFTGSVRIGLNGIIGFSRYPLQIITWIGLITFTFAMVLGAGLPVPAARRRRDRLGQPDPGHHHLASSAASSC